MVGFGEAALAPAAFSLLSTLFPRERLSLANGIYFTGTSLGGALVFTFGGMFIAYLNTTGGFEFPLAGRLKPWQSVFVFAGLAGLILAFLAFLLQEAAQTLPSKTVSQPKGETLREFGTRRGRLWLCHTIAISCLNMTAYAMIAWTPAFLGRVHKLDIATIGLVIGISYGVCGAISNVACGAIIDRMWCKGIVDAHYRLYFITTLIGIPIAVLALVVDNAALSIVLICFTWLIMMGQGPMSAALQIFSPLALRGRVCAATNLAVGIFALGLTPFLIGALTENVFQDRSKVGLSIAVFVAVFGLLAAAVLQFARPLVAEAIADDRSNANATAQIGQVAYTTASD
jgi:MFS family permease